MFNLVNVIMAEAGTYGLGLDGTTLFANMIAVIKDNIAPILALMGLALGAGWVIKYFRKARKGGI